METESEFVPALLDTGKAGAVHMTILSTDGFPTNDQLESANQEVACQKKSGYLA